MTLAPSNPSESPVESKDDNRMKALPFQDDSSTAVLPGAESPRLADRHDRVPRGPIQWQRWNSTGEASVRAAELARSIPLSGLPVGGKDWTTRTALLGGGGAVGGVALEHLARAGVGTIWLVDPARYRPTSFLTQPIEAACAGQPKAWVQGARAHRIQPAVTIIAGLGYIEDVPWSILYAADVWIAAGDSELVPRYLGGFVKKFSRRMIQASVFGPTSTAIVRGYSADPRTACPLCDFDPAAELSEAPGGSCDPMLAAPTVAPPTRTQSTVCALAGTLGAHEALTALGGHDQLLLDGEELVHCLSSHRVMRSTLAVADDCIGEHAPADLVRWDGDWDETTPAMLAAELDLDVSTPIPIQSELPWVTTGSCITCGKVQPVRRFGRLGADVGRCECGEVVRPLPRGLRDTTPARDAAYCWNRPLGQLGLPADRGVALRDGNRSVYVLPPIPEHLLPTPLGE